MDELSICSRRKLWQEKDDFTEVVLDKARRDDAPWVNFVFVIDREKSIGIFTEVHHLWWMFVGIKEHEVEGAEIEGPLRGECDHDEERLGESAYCHCEGELT